MLRGNVEEGSIFLTPIFPSHMRCMNSPNPALAINSNLYCHGHKSSFGYTERKWPNLQSSLMDPRIQKKKSQHISVTLKPCGSGLNADSAHWIYISGKTDYSSLEQMPVPVNNVKGKQQLNDQTHYSSRQIKATRDSDVTFTKCVCLCVCAEVDHVSCMCFCI